MCLIDYNQKSERRNSKATNERESGRWCETSERRDEEKYKIEMEWKSAQVNGMEWDGVEMYLGKGVSMNALGIQSPPRTQRGSLTTEQRTRPVNVVDHAVSEAPAPPPTRSSFS